MLRVGGEKGKVQNSCRNVDAEDAKRYKVGEPGCTWLYPQCQGKLYDNCTYVDSLEHGVENGVAFPN